MTACFIIILFVLVVRLNERIDYVSRHHYKQEMNLHKRIKELEDNRE